MTRPRLLPLALLLALLGGARARAAAPRVVLDPGHGGAQAGAQGPLGVHEKDLALALARRLRAALARQGVQVFLTREDDEDVPLTERVARANALRPDLFLSLHANSMPTRRLRARTEGVETFFLSAYASGAGARATAARENGQGAAAPTRRAGDDTLAFILQDLVRTEAHQDSSRLAYALHARVVKGSGATDRGVQQAPFFVLSGVEAPAVLVEVGFISHPEEGRKLASAAYQETLARALADGVVGFLLEVARRDGRAAAGPVAAPGAP